MSSNYEMMYILRPDLSEEQVGEAVEKYKNYLSENGAEDVQVQVKGKRRLAYPVKKHLDGIYVQMNFQSDGSQIASLERMMRLSEEVIRYLSLKLNKRSLKAFKLAEEQPESAAEPVEA
ncbi:MAG: hypothetical protein Tsb0014_07560 [Pleurocapsa sp.]